MRGASGDRGPLGRPGIDGPPGQFVSRGFGNVVRTPWTGKSHFKLEKHNVNYD